MEGEAHFNVCGASAACMGRGSRQLVRASPAWCQWNWDLIWCENKDGKHFHFPLWLPVKGILYLNQKVVIECHREADSWWHLSVLLSHRLCNLYAVPLVWLIHLWRWTCPSCPRSGMRNGRASLDTSTESPDQVCFLHLLKITRTRSIICELEVRSGIKKSSPTWPRPAGIKNPTRPGPSPIN